MYDISRIFSGYLVDCCASWVLHNVVSYLLDGCVSNPLLSNVQVMRTLPTTAMSQMRPKVDASAIKVHGKLTDSVAEASSSEAATWSVASGVVSVAKLNQLDGTLLTLNAICIFVG